MVSWKRFVLEAKNVGAVIDTALASAWEMTPLMSPFPSFWSDVAFTGVHKHLRSAQHTDI